MGLESASFISQLNPANPVGGVDNYSTADDHLRLLKSVLQLQFTSLGAAAVTRTAAQLNFVDATSSIQTQLDAKEILTNKNANNGYAGLNASAQLLDARVQQSNVTQHQAAFALAGSQITSGSVALARLGSGSPTSSNYLRGDASWSTIAAADVATGTFSNARFVSGNITQFNATIAPAFSNCTGAVNVATQLAGSILDAQIQQSNVTQHQAALSIAETQIPNGTLLARLADNETITGNWTFNGFLAEQGTISPASFGTQQDNWNPAGLSTATHIRVQTSANPTDVTGLVAQTGGRRLTIHFVSVGGATLRLMNNSASSTAANRFAIQSNLTLTQDGVINLWYDDLSSVWRLA